MKIDSQEQVAVISCGVVKDSKIKVDEFNEDGEPKVIIMSGDFVNHDLVDLFITLTKVMFVVNYNCDKNQVRFVSMTNAEKQIVDRIAIILCKEDDLKAVVDKLKELFPRY
jgi:predicted phosphodiesterase